MFFTKLSTSYDRSSFDCGNIELNTFLKEYATSFVKRKLCQVHVLVDNNVIIGFYTISPFTLDIRNFPEKIARKYPKSMPFPCWLLGKLALDKKYQGQKLGEKLLMAACDQEGNLRLTGSVEVHAARLSNEDAGGFCVIVDAKDQNVKDFYLKYGFIAFIDDPLRLYLPLPTPCSGNK